MGQLPGKWETWDMMNGNKLFVPPSTHMNIDRIHDMLERETLKLQKKGKKAPVFTIQQIQDKTKFLDAKGNKRVIDRRQIMTALFLLAFKEPQPYVRMWTKRFFSKTKPPHPAMQVKMIRSISGKVK
ncbi:MAG: hypothetical protein ACE5RP_00025 [Nitrosopumilus sp.]